MLNASGKGILITKEVKFKLILSQGLIDVAQIKREIRVRLTDAIHISSMLFKKR